MSKALFQISFTAKQPPRQFYGEWKADYIAERRFFDWTADYNYLSYILNDSKVVKNKDSRSYYTREGNLGLFNADGVISEKKCEELKKKLATTDSIIWHGFISFDAETSKGFTAQDQAIKFLNRSFNSFIDRTHLDRNNIEMFASLHTDTPHHHHIHFSFFEKEPKRIDKHGNKIFTTKGSFRQNVIDNYVISANMHLSENTAEYYTARDRAIGKLKEIRAAATQEFSNREVQAKVMELAQKLPKEGRLQYSSENMRPLRQEIDILANILLRMNPEAYDFHRATLQAIARREEEARGIAEDITIKSKSEETTKEQKVKRFHELVSQTGKVNETEYTNKLRTDYIARLGNQAIGLALDMRRKFYREEGEGKQRKIAARRNRERAKRVYGKFMYTLSSYARQAHADFMKDFSEIEREIERENRVG